MIKPKTEVKKRTMVPQQICKNGEDTIFFSNLVNYNPKREEVKAKSISENVANIWDVNSSTTHHERRSTFT